MSHQILSNILRRLGFFKEFKKFGGPNYRFFQTDLGGWFFRESIRNSTAASLERDSSTVVFLSILRKFFKTPVLQNTSGRLLPAIIFNLNQHSNLYENFKSNLIQILLESWRFFDVFRRYRKRPVACNGLLWTLKCHSWKIFVHLCDLNSAISSPVCYQL